MGRPVLQYCAKKGCDKCNTDLAERQGEEFSVQICFFRGLSACEGSKLWACCPDHKEAALQLVLQGMPYRAQSKPED